MELYKLRNLLIHQEEGKMLLEYLQDYVTQEATKSREALEIKGMCALIQKIKEIPAVVERQHSK